MKKFLKWSLILLALLLFFIWGSFRYFEFFEYLADPIAKSLGDYKSKQSWETEPNQDINEFRIYTYSSADPENSRYFDKLSPEDIETLGLFLDNYEQWIDAYARHDPEGEWVANYAFDRGLIDTQDYFYIYTRYEDHPLHNYDVWFFDSQTKTLYYFHANI